MFVVSFVVFEGWVLAFGGIGFFEIGDSLFKGFWVFGGESFDDSVIDHGGKVSFSKLYFLFAIYIISSPVVVVVGACNGFSVPEDSTGFDRVIVVEVRAVGDGE